MLILTRKSLWEPGQAVNILGRHMLTLSSQRASWAFRPVFVGCAGYRTPSSEYLACVDLRGCALLAQSQDPTTNYPSDRITLLSHCCRVSKICTRHAQVTRLADLDRK